MSSVLKTSSSSFTRSLSSKSMAAPSATPSKCTARSSSAAGRSSSARSDAVSQTTSRKLSSSSKRKASAAAMLPSEGGRASKISKKLSGAAKGKSTVSEKKERYDSADLYHFTIRVSPFLAKADFGCEREVTGQDVKLLVNSKDTVSVSQLVQMLRAKVPFGSKQRATLLWKNSTGAWISLIHSHELLQIWELYAVEREVVLHGIVEDIGKESEDLGAAAASAAAADYRQRVDEPVMFSIQFQVETYMGKQGDQASKTSAPTRVDITVNSKTVTIAEVREALSKQLPVCTKEMARIRWWHAKRNEFIEVSTDDDVMQILRRKKNSRKVFFLADFPGAAEPVDVVEIVEDEETEETDETEETEESYDDDE